ncbi:MAG: hypothetical protein MUO21_02350, partial [Nitrososphaeraceae archaeon]|nr:hypothetical protein [Nitrososphaeraceae archaeon]
PFYGGDIDTFLQKCKLAHSRRIFGKHSKNKRKFNKFDIETGFSRFVQSKKEDKLNPSIRQMYT